MNKVLELFGHPAGGENIDWAMVVRQQRCPYLCQTCYKVRKSDPKISIGTCAVRYGAAGEPVVICPARLLERRQVFIDCLHLLTLHEPGNELHVVPEVTVPGGSVDYFLVSVASGKAVDFVGVELQALDTTGTVWPERQRLLADLGVQPGRRATAVDPAKSFGINWKMTAKTILVQMHHKVSTFEHLNKKLVLVLQDRLLDYMAREFNFQQLSASARQGDPLHIHSYALRFTGGHAGRVGLASRRSTDADGIAACLGLNADPKVELQQILLYLQAKLGPSTRYLPV